jgi:hypothetical protein
MGFRNESRSSTKGVVRRHPLYWLTEIKKDGDNYVTLVEERPFMQLAARRRWLAGEMGTLSLYGFDRGLKGTSEIENVKVQRRPAHLLYLC